MTDYQKLAEYKELEEMGRLVRLAVTVDGYLYKIVPAGKAHELRRV